MSQVIVSTILRDTLISLPAIQTLTVWTAGVYKVFWEHVDETVPLPYITLSHFSGSVEPFNPYCDMVWKVVASTANMDNAVAFANAIHELHELCPVVNTVKFPGAFAYTTMSESMPVFDRYQVQNVPLFVVGGLYRIRLCLGEV